jgi:dTDP-4-dehydrorhamnose 3,5-epimerase
MSGSPKLRVTPLPLAGACTIEPMVFGDERGTFVKTLHAAQLAEAGLHFELREEFYSTSHRGVLRGMHFQTPPHAHQKLVSCIAGRVLDVLVDLRRGSATYGKSCSIELSADSPQVVWIPSGFAHGFLSLTDGATVLYRTDCEHAAQNDGGIRWNSFGFDWSLPSNELIISPRDRAHPALADFVSPFVVDVDSKVA